MVRKSKNGEKVKPNIRGLLHDHIDGSAVVANILHALYKQAKKKYPFASAEHFLEFFKNPQIDIVERFRAITSVLQTKESLEILGFNYARQRAKEGYVYVEGKFAPQYHTAGGLTMRQATDAIIQGIRLGEKEFGISVTPVICIGREADEKTGLAIAKIAVEYDGELVLDLVCDEANHPPEKHFHAYELTFGTNVKRDCHAGEWVFPEPKETYKERLLDNIRTAIFDLRCHGIGHAIPLGEDDELIGDVLDKGIRIAGCPLSNLRSGLITNVRDLHIDRLLDGGVCYTMNSDDDLFLPKMDVVVAECDAEYDFSETQAKRLEENVFLGAFGKIHK